jgi:hypothetical protein
MERRLAAGALAAALSFAALGTTRTAHAYDIEGIGVGADLSLGGISGVAINIGLGGLELEVIAGASFVLPDNGILLPRLATAFGVFATIAGGDTTNLQIGGRFGAILDSQTGIDPTTGGQTLITFGIVTIEGDLRVQHRLDEHAVLIFQVGAIVAIDPERDPVFAFGIGQTGLTGSAGFRFFFDELGGGAPAPVMTSSPSPAPATTTTTSTTTSTSTEPAQEQTPYWEQ